MVGYASNRSIEIGTLEHIIVIDASFDPVMYISIYIYIYIYIYYESQPKAWAEYRYK